jgi:hypothetical protein
MTFDIDDGGSVMCIDVIDADAIGCNGKYSAQAKCQEIGSGRRMGGKHTRQGIPLVFSRMNPQDPSFFGGVVLMEPVNDMDVRKGFQTQECITEFVTDVDFRHVIALSDEAYGINLIDCFHPNPRNLRSIDSFGNNSLIRIGLIDPNVAKAGG